MEVWGHKNVSAKKKILWVKELLQWAFEFRMPGLNIYMLTNHNYLELLENILVLLILNFYISTDKLFQCWYSCFLKRVYVIHNLIFSWGVSANYKTNYYTKTKIAKPYSIIEECEIFGPKMHNPRLEMVLFKNAPTCLFSSSQWSFSAVASLPDDSSLHFYYSFLVSINTWSQFSNSL